MIMEKQSFKKLIERAVPKKVIKQNAEALKAFGRYKETSDILDRAEIALGRKPAYKVAIGSTLNFELNQYAVASTTAQNI